MPRLTWPERFEKARKTGRFTEADINAAEDWRHCAVGEQKPDLGKRWHEGDWYMEHPMNLSHIEEKIFDLGSRFANDVRSFRVDDAEYNYKEIQKWLVKV